MLSSDEMTGHNYCGVKLAGSTRLRYNRQSNAMTIESLNTTRPHDGKIFIQNIDKVGGGGI